MNFFLLLAMQAAGMIIDYKGTEKEERFMNLGQSLDQASFDTNIEQTKLAAQDASLQALRQLRQNMGSQIAAFAARGTKAGAGSALSFMNEASSNFNEDEKMRRLNMLSQQKALKSNLIKSRLQNAADISKLWQGYTTRTLNRFTTSPAALGQGISSFAQGFGLTSL